MANHAKENANGAHAGGVLADACGDGEACWERAADAAAELVRAGGLPRLTAAGGGWLSQLRGLGFGEGGQAGVRDAQAAAGFEEVVAQSAGLQKLLLAFP